MILVTLWGVLAGPTPIMADRPLAPCQGGPRPPGSPEVLSTSPAGNCGPHWVEGFADPGMNDRASAVGLFDDGNGLALYVGGWFTSVNGVSASRVAKWDGTTWSPLGPGLGPSFGVHTMVGFDPPGPAQGSGLYVGGSFNQAGGIFVSRIARWDGSDWSALGSGAQGTVDGMTVFDDGLGGGSALYVGGQFTSMGGVPNTIRVAKWNGATWSALSTGVEAQVTALLPFDEDGPGLNPPALFAGGYFETAGGLQRQFIARWNGVEWSDVGGPASLDQHVHALHVFDDGNGEALYVGGHFTTAAGQPVRHIARWDGSNWSPVGNGFNGEVLAITHFDDRSGGGPRLYVGGFFFRNFEGVSMPFIARWTGSAWVSLDGGVNDAVWSLATFDDGTGNNTALYAGGWFLNAGGLTSRRVAQWNGVGTVPVIDQSPGNVSVPAGDGAVFTSAASGTPPLGYQWRKGGLNVADGGAISGATTPTLTINPVSPADAGAYDVLVTNDCGSTPSASAALTVTGAPCQDTDLDGDVDGSDYASFFPCLTGPSGGVAPGCAAADCDADLDVDLSEFAGFQSAFTAPSG